MVNKSSKSDLLYRLFNPPYRPTPTATPPEGLQQAMRTPAHRFFCALSGKIQRKDPQIRERPDGCTAPRRGRGHARPVPHSQFWECPDSCAAPRRGRGHARPVPHWQIWGYSDWCTRRVGNAFMRSETRPFAPKPGTFRRPLLPGRAWPGPYNGPAEPFWCGGYRRPGAGGTHKCVPYRAFAAVGVHPANRPLQWPGGMIWVHPT